MSNIQKGSGLIYTTGIPNTIPVQGTDSEFAIDVNGNQYAWNRNNSVWDNLGQAIEIATSSGVPTHIPSKFRPRFVVTPDRNFYFYASGWGSIGSLPSGLLSSSNGFVSSSAQVKALLPNGVFSSSVQIGPTGIYNGSGTIPSGTIAKSFFDVENPSTNYIQYLYNTIGIAESLGDGNFQNGVESFYNDFSSIFAGINTNERDVYRIQGIDLASGENERAIFKVRPYDIQMSYETATIPNRSVLIDSNGITIDTSMVSYSQTDTNLTIEIKEREETSGSFTISDNRGLARGLEYSQDYSLTYSNRSLTDKAYVDNSLKSSFSAQLDNFYYGTQPESVNTAIPAISASSYYVHRVTFTSSLDLDKAFVGFRFTNNLVSASLYRNYGMPMHSFMVPDSTARDSQFTQGSNAGIYGNAFLIYKDYSKAIRLYAPSFGNEVSGSTQLYNKLLGKGVPLGILSYSDMGNILVGHYSAGGNTRGSFYTGNSSVICESMWFEQTGSDSVLSIAFRNTGITISTSSIMQVYKIPS